MADDKDMISILVHDHREVEQMFVELETGQRDPKQRRDLVDKVITELVRHSVAEEEYLYPFTREVLPNGDQIADREIREHAEAEETMKSLEEVDATDSTFDQLLTRLMSDIRAHIEEEEDQLFPQLRAACDESRLIELGNKISQAKKVAPTRPHPSAPDKPPMDKILAPGAGLVDRIRDARPGRAH